jgi:hypothetical protein
MASEQVYVGKAGAKELYRRVVEQIPAVDGYVDPESGNAVSGRAVAEALASKVDAEEGKGLSSNDFTDADADKLDGIAEGAEPNVIDTVNVDGVPLDVEDRSVNVDLSGKADRDTGAVDGNLAMFSDGDPVDSGVPSTAVVTGARIGEGEPLPVDEGIIRFPGDIVVNDGELSIKVGSSEPVTFSANSADDVSVTVDAGAIGLGNVDNTSDMDKPVSTAVTTALGAKANRVASAHAGNLASLDADGNLADSGASATDFATAAQGAVADTAVQSVRIGLSGSELKDGTSVVIPVATTSVAGATVLSSDVDSDSEEAAATSLAVKSVRDELSGLITEESAARVSGQGALSQAIADEATRARGAEDGIVSGYTAFKRGGAGKNFMKIASLTSSMASAIGGVSSVYLSFDIYMFDTLSFGPSVGTYSGKFWIDGTGALVDPEGTQSFVVRTMDDTGTAVTRPYNSIRCVLSGAEISVWLEIDSTRLPSSLVPTAICTANKAVRKDGTSFNNPFSFADGLVTGVDASEVPAGGVVIYPVSVASMQAVNGKANLVSGATEGNLAAIGADGNLVDSTKSVSDFATAAQGALADSAYQKPGDGIPGDDLSVEVQASLAKADTALQAADIEGKANKDEMAIESVQGDDTKKNIQLHDGLSQDVVIAHQDVSGKADKDEMSVTAVQGDETKKTIQLYDGLSQDVVIAHQDISGKVDAVEGKGLSSNDYTDADAEKLANLPADAEANVIVGVSVDGSALTPDSNRTVDIPMASYTPANGDDQAVYVAGAMSGEDKEKLDGLAAWVADDYVIPEAPQVGG